MYVAVIDGVVVGYLVADLGDDQVVRIDQVWVTPDARELGFGDALLAEAIAVSRTRGAVAVEGQALPGDRHTKNLYERGDRGPPDHHVPLALSERVSGPSTAGGASR